MDIMIERSLFGRRRYDYRMICPCQLHAREERRLSSRARHVAARLSGHLRQRAVALIIGVPLAFGALGFPSEAMNTVSRATEGMLSGPRPRITRVAPPAAETRPLPMFTSSNIARDFLTPGASVQTFTLELTKEEFFRTHIPYGSIIYREAKRNRLAPELVAAIVASESDFRPRLISNKNAQGLMQIVPSTGKLMGVDDLFNPAENIAAGTRYLRYLCDRFGDQRIALAAYNAGEGNVERWGGVPPFEETLTYLQRVSARTRDYRDRIHVTYLTSVRLSTPIPR